MHIVMDFGSPCQYTLQEPFFPLSSTFLQNCPQNCTFPLLISLRSRAQMLRLSLTGAGHSPGKARRPAASHLVARLHLPGTLSPLFLGKGLHQYWAHV